MIKLHSKEAMATECPAITIRPPPCIAVEYRRRICCWQRVGTAVVMPDAPDRPKGPREEVGLGESLAYHILPRE